MTQEDINNINAIFRGLPTTGSFKQVQGQLNKLADLLPKTAYKVSYIKREQLIDLTSNEFKRSGFADIGILDTAAPTITTEALEFVESKDTAYRHNNTRRMLKKAWNSKAKLGIREVIARIDTNNKLINSEHTVKTVMKVADAIIREKIKPIFQ